MAGFSFGTSHWDDIPQRLGLTAQGDGYMRGLWRGHAVDAHFYNQHDDQRDSYSYYTALGLWFEPTLGVAGLEGGELFERAVPEHSSKPRLLWRSNGARCMRQR